jgi:hypothetical protein
MHMREVLLIDECTTADVLNKNYYKDYYNNSGS